MFYFMRNRRRDGVQNIVYSFILKERSVIKLFLSYLVFVVVMTVVVVLTMMSNDSLKKKLRKNSFKHLI